MARHSSHVKSASTLWIYAMQLRMYRMVSLCVYMYVCYGFVCGWVGGCGCVLPPVQVYCSIDMQALTFVLVRLNSLVFIIRNCCLSIWIVCDFETECKSYNTMYNLQFDLRFPTLKNIYTPAWYCWKRGVAYIVWGSDSYWCPSPFPPSPPVSVLWPSLQGWLLVLPFQVWREGET